MRIALGCDEVGFPLLEVIRGLLATADVEVVDFGVHSTDPVLYPNVALEVAQAVAAGTCDRGILICGTGIGMSITANKVPTVRAALCHDTYSAERARKSNDAQILTMGARVIGSEVAKQIVNAWLQSDFEGGGSLPKVVRMKEIDEEFRGPA
jgi:ribose 5-phosphate isomerase B